MDDMNVVDFPIDLEMLADGFAEIERLGKRVHEISVQGPDGCTFYDLVEVDDAIKPELSVSLSDLSVWGVSVQHDDAENSILILKSSKRRDRVVFAEKVRTCIKYGL